jgi:hypothetical protein
MRNFLVSDVRTLALKVKRSRIGSPISPDYAMIATVDPGKSQIVEVALNAVYRVR